MDGEQEVEQEPENEERSGTAEQDDIRAAIQESVNELEEKEGGEPAKEPEIEAQGAEPKPGEQERAEHGKFKPRGDVEPGATARAQPGAPKPQLEAQPLAVKPPEAAPPPVPQKFPQSWKADVRELAKKLPAEFRPIVEEALRREAEVSQLAERAGQHERAVGAVREILAPYEQLIRAEQRGQTYDPLGAVQTLLETAATLRTGTTEEKLEVASGIVRSYGVPPAQLVARILYESGANTKEAMEALDKEIGQHYSALTARGGAPNTRREQSQQFRDPRVDDLLARQQQDRESGAREAMERGKVTVEKFATGHEFYEDVREEMGRLMHIATQEKRVLSLDDAYDQATWANQKVRKVLLQREAATDAKKRSDAAAKARGAARSVRSSPVGATKPKPAGETRYQDDLRSDIEEAADEVSNRA